MQEEVTQRTVALCVEATKLSAGMLQQAMKKVLDEMQKGVTGHKTKLHHGKQTLRQLMKHNTGVFNIEITDQNIRAFSATAKKYGIDFALKKDTSGEIKSFEKLREKAGLPKVVFHSLRHSSTTYKLKLNHGDLKATQGDTGHAQIDMITSVYAHILDEDRKINAQKFESAFYANPDLRSVRPPEEPKEPAPATLDLEDLVEQLRKSPELANTLAALLASAPSEK